MTKEVVAFTPRLYLFPRIASSVSPTIAPAALAAIAGGRATAGTNLPVILAVLRGPWLTIVVDTVFTPTFNTDGTSARGP